MHTHEDMKRDCKVVGTALMQTGHVIHHVDTVFKRDKGMILLYWKGLGLPMIGI